MYAFMSTQSPSIVIRDGHLQQAHPHLIGRGRDSGVGWGCQPRFCIRWGGHGASGYQSDATSAADGLLTAIVVEVWKLLMSQEQDSMLFCLILVKDWANPDGGKRRSTVSR